MPAVATGAAQCKYLVTGSSSAPKALLPSMRQRCNLRVDLLGDHQGVINLDAKVTHSAFELGVPQE